MAGAVSDEDNPMLLHKPKRKEPDLYGSNIPMDPKVLACAFKEKENVLCSFVKHVTGNSDWLTPVVKVCPSPSGKPVMGVMVGIKGTF